MSVFSLPLAPSSSVSGILSQKSLPAATPIADTESTLLINPLVLPFSGNCFGTRRAMNLVKNLVLL
jgi:hypothetical protein